MANRQVTTQGSAGRSFGGPGRFSGSLDAGKVGGASFSAAGDAVSRSGTVSLSGLGTFAQGAGASTVPVNMTMASWRNAAAAGMISPLGSSAPGRKAGIGPASFGVSIDLRDFNRLAAQIGGIATAINSGHVILSQAINHGVRKLNTLLKYRVKDWTGIKRVGEVTKGFSFGWSTPATLTGRLVVKDYYRALTAANFDAKWQRRNPGATHKAWNRGQLAPHTFMTSPDGPIFRRTGSGRLPIRVLWGPNFAREIQRHKPEVQAVVDDAGRHVHREAERLLRVAVSGTGRR